MRKEVDITIKDAGRDRGKVFHLTEMAAMKGERWATRALIALARGGLDIPEDAMNAGMAGLAQISFGAMLKLTYTDLEPLLDEMLECILFVPDPKQPNVRRPLIEDDIEEVATIIKLRAELLTLHTGFTLNAGPSKSQDPASASEVSESIPMSRAPSGPSFQPIRQVSPN